MASRISSKQLIRTPTLKPKKKAKSKNRIYKSANGLTVYLKKYAHKLNRLYSILTYKLAELFRMIWHELRIPSSMRDITINVILIVVFYSIIMFAMGVLK